jgi:protein-S-isoprenylcysteine O-methyltransferase Ste14
VAFAAMLAGIAGLYVSGALFASHWTLRLLQIAAFALMIAARLTFGRRSFHASADPTSGGLVTSGTYAYLRHPIYAAIIYFTWAGALDHLSWPVLGWAGLVTAGAFIRMRLEERLLIGRYPEYREYRNRVKRIVPFVY